MNECAREGDRYVSDGMSVLMECASEEQHNEQIHTYVGDGSQRLTNFIILGLYMNGGWSLACLLGESSTTSHHLKGWIVCVQPVLTSIFSIACQKESKNR